MNEAWEIIGEDHEAVYAEGHLPCDWRTKARAIHSWSHEVGEPVTIAELRKLDLPKLGVECWAPPGDYYGGTFISTCADGGVPDGWHEMGEEHVWCPEDWADDSECAGRPDIICLNLDRYDKDVVDEACRTAPESVHLITAGEGWPWISRTIRPVTVVDVT